MDIFAIDQPTLAELVLTEKELEQLSQIWGIVQEWEQTYNGWKDGLFRDLKAQELEEAAAKFNKRY